MVHRTRAQQILDFGSSIGLKYISHFPDLFMAMFKPRETQGTHHMENKMESAVSVRGACSGRMQPTRLQSNKACCSHGEIMYSEPNSTDFYV